MRLLSAMNAFAHVHCMAIDTTTYLADAKNVYGAVQDQVNTEAAFMNLLGDGSKFGKPVNQAGIRGYTFLARLAPNYNMGYRPEGYTGIGNGVSNAGNQGMANATVLLKYAYVPILITGQANELTKGEKRAFMQAKAMEAKFDMKDIVAHVNVVMCGAQRGGALAQVASVQSASQFTVSSANNLPLAKYLRVGMPIDSGPIGGGLTIGALLISAINYATGVVNVTDKNGNAPATPVNANDNIYLAGECPAGAGSFPYTAEGLISLIASTGQRQGLDPSVAGQAPWQSFTQNMAGATISAQQMMALRQLVKIRSGADINFFLTSPGQINALVGIATQLLQFRTDVKESTGKRALDLGYNVFEYNGLPIIEEKDLSDDRLYALSGETWKKFEALPLSMADDEAGDWTRLSGSNGIADAVQGLLRWYHQLGTLQRNSAGVQYNYSVPAAFLNQPPSF